MPASPDAIAPVAGRRSFAMRAVMISLLIVCGTVALMASLAAPFVLPRPQPSGPHAVGFQVSSVDGGAREIGVELWYPADDGGVPFKLIDDVLAHELSVHLGMPDTGDDAVVFARRDAPVKSGRWPVVLFNHGAASFSRQNSIDFEELASTGVVVLSLSHPGSSLVTRLGNGQVVTLDERNAATNRRLSESPDAVGVAMAKVLEAVRATTTPDEHHRASVAFAAIEPWSSLAGDMASWEADTIAVMNALERWPFIDSNNVVLMGHSLGGTVSFRVAAAEPSRVRGVIDLDGPIVPASADAPRVTTPTLAMLSTQAKVGKAEVSLAGSLRGAFPDGTAQFVELPGTGHYNFTDLNEVPLLRHLTPLLGSADGRVVRQAQREAIRTFLAKVLTR